MDPDIRPQDDLFGHVNGRWLDDRRDPRRPVELGAVRAAAPTPPRSRSARSSRSLRRAATPTSPASTTTPARSATSTPLHGRGARSRRSGAEPVQAAARRGRRAARRPRPGGVPRRASSGAAAAACSAPTSTPTTATPTATSSTSCRAALGLPDESYYREEKFAEIREKYVDYLETDARRWPATPTPAGAAATVMDVETRLAAGPLGARRDPRRP